MQLISPGLAFFLVLHLAPLNARLYTTFRVYKSISVIMIRRRLAYSVLRLIYAGALPADRYKDTALERNGDFRLLHFFTDVPGDSKYTLERASLNSDVEYIALSYVWGTSGTTARICCSGVNFNISDNLAIILPTLRNFFKKEFSTEIARIPIWVDAICINQADAREKEGQVKIMGQIYRKAEMVIAFLGDADDETEDVIVLINKLFEVFIEWGPDMDRGVSFEQLRLQHAHRLPRWDDPVVLAFRKFFLRPWFSRAWTFQEALLSQRFLFLCGPHSIQAENLFAAVIVAGVSGYTVNYPEPHFFQDLWRFRETIADGEAAEDGSREKEHMQRYCQLSNLLRITRDRDATDPRDKIYSLLAIVQLKNDPLLKINYDRPVEEVYTDATRYCIEREQDLRVLGSAAWPFPTKTNKCTPNLPSWVPDWQIHTPEIIQLSLSTTLPESNEFARPIFEASGDSKPCIIPCSDPRSLCLKGFIVGQIEHVDNESHGKFISETADVEPDDYFAEMNRFACSLGLDDLSSAPEGFMSPIQMLLVAGLFPTNPRWNHDAYEFTVRDTIHWVKQGMPQPFPRRVLDEYILKTDSVCPERSIFMTKDKKYIGLCPQECRPRDYICILLGGNVPYIMRPRVSSIGDEGTNAKWDFMGECYVQGIMYGEAMERINTKDFKYTNFEIC